MSKSDINDLIKNMVDKKVYTQMKQEAAAGHVTIFNLLVGTYILHQRKLEDVICMSPEVAHAVYDGYSIDDSLHQDSASPKLRIISLTTELCHHEDHEIEWVVGALTNELSQRRKARDGASRVLRTASGESVPQGAGFGARKMAAKGGMFNALGSAAATTRLRERRHERKPSVTSPFGSFALGSGEPLPATWKDAYGINPQIERYLNNRVQFLHLPLTWDTALKVVTPSEPSREADGLAARFMAANEIIQALLASGPAMALAEPLNATAQDTRFIIENGRCLKLYGSVARSVIGAYLLSLTAEPKGREATDAELQSYVRFLHDQFITRKRSVIVGDILAELLGQPDASLSSLIFTFNLAVCVDELRPHCDNRGLADYMVKDTAMLVALQLISMLSVEPEFGWINARDFSSEADVELVDLQAWYDTVDAWTRYTCPPEPMGVGGTIASGINISQSIVEPELTTPESRLKFAARAEEVAKELAGIAPLSAEALPKAERIEAVNQAVSQLVPPVEPGDYDWSNKPLASIIKSGRAVNALERAGIQSIAALLGYTAEELLSKEGFGEKTLAATRDALRRYNLYLKGESEAFLNDLAVDAAAAAAAAEAAEAPASEPTPAPVSEKMPEWAGDAPAEVSTTPSETPAPVRETIALSREDSMDQLEGVLLGIGEELDAFDLESSSARDINTWMTNMRRSCKDLGDIELPSVKDELGMREWPSLSVEERIEVAKRTLNKAFSLMPPTQRQHTYLQSISEDMGQAPNFYVEHTKLKFARQIDEMNWTEVENLISYFVQMSTKLRESDAAQAGFDDNETPF